jgi:hypothetical protein
MVNEKCSRHGRDASGLRDETGADRGRHARPVDPGGRAGARSRLLGRADRARVNPVDVNRADAATLAALPGLDAADAERIVAGRPYGAKEDLVRRHILDARQYNAVERRIVVGPPGMPAYLGAVPPQPEGP